MEHPIVIVGASHAGSELATGLRKRGYQGRIVLVGEEAHLPYQRPPLSKAFLLGKVGAQQLAFRPQTAYEQANIELRLGMRVASIHRERSEVIFADGDRLSYDKLVLATGSRPRWLPLPGVNISELQNLFALRTLADAESLRPRLAAGQRLAIIGGGYIGLEVAAVATQLGAQVTVIEALPRLLSRVTGKEVAAFMEKIHRGHGVNFRLATPVRQLELDATQKMICGVLVDSSDGAERIEADLVLLAIGIVPNTELASAAGLAVDNGVVVDEHARTSDPAILAIGDCANQINAFAGGRVRLESVPNAIEHARVAAATLLGQPEASQSAPWFWSEQYGFRLQMVGLFGDHDRCVTRELGDGKELLAFYLKAGRLIAADVVNRPADFAQARRLVGGRASVDPERLADPQVALSELAF